MQICVEGDFGNEPRLLDLFCGAGGAAVGYRRAGFRVEGMDIEPQPRYPFPCWQRDALTVDPNWVADHFDAVHASPPCHAYSSATLGNRARGHVYPDLVGPTRELLENIGLPYVIENVPGSPLIDPILLCGTMFRGLRVIRHRLFEVSFPAPTLPRRCDNYHPKVWCKDFHLMPDDSYVTVAGNAATLPLASAAMGIDWMGYLEVRQAIPPAYTERIADHLLLHV